MYKIAVFDVDGTLLNTEKGLFAAVGYTLETLGYPALSEEVMRTFIGPPIMNSFQKTYGVEGEELAHMTKVFRDRYKEHDLLLAEPYEGIYEVCDELHRRGVQIAVATYKRQDYALSLLKHFKFDRYSDIMYGSDAENKLKKVDIIKKCMDDLGVKDYKEALMIGDSDNDAIGAEALGVDFLGVTYGFGFHAKEDVHEFRAIGSADTTKDILKYF